MTNIPDISTKLLIGQSELRQKLWSWAIYICKLYPKEEAAAKPYLFNGSSGAESVSQHAKDAFNGSFHLKQFKLTSQKNATSPRCI